MGTGGCDPRPHLVLSPGPSQLMKWEQYIMYSIIKIKICHHHGAYILLAGVLPFYVYQLLARSIIHWEQLTPSRDYSYSWLLTRLINVSSRLHQHNWYHAWSDLAVLLFLISCLCATWWLIPDLPQNNKDHNVIIQSDKLYVWYRSL